MYKHIITLLNNSSKPLLIESEAGNFGNPNCFIDLEPTFKPRERSVILAKSSINMELSFSPCKDDLTIDNLAPNLSKKLKNSEINSLKEKNKKLLSKFDDYRSFNFRLNRMADKSKYDDYYVVDASFVNDANACKEHRKCKLYPLTNFHFNYFKIVDGYTPTPNVRHQSNLEFDKNNIVINDNSYKKSFR